MSWIGVLLFFHKVRLPLLVSSIKADQVRYCVVLLFAHIGTLDKTFPLLNSSRKIPTYFQDSVNTWAVMAHIWSFQFIWPLAPHPFCRRRMYNYLHNSLGLFDAPFVCNPIADLVLATPQLGVMRMGCSPVVQFPKMFWMQNGDLNLSRLIAWQIHNVNIIMIDSTWSMPCINTTASVVPQFTPLFQNIHMYDYDNDDSNGDNDAGPCLSWMHGSWYSLSKKLLPCWSRYLYLNGIGNLFQWH